MNAAQFWEKLAEVNAASGAYMAGEAGWVGIWVNVLMLVIVSGLVLMFKYREARWFVLANVYVVISALFINMATDGPTKLWGLSHVLFWPPIVIYFLNRLRQTGLQGWYPKWMLVVVATLTASLVLDVYDVYRFFSV